MVFSVEEIPDRDKLYCRIHKQCFRNNEIIPGAIINRGTGMSTDWSKYSTSRETKQRANRFPENNAVVSMIAGEVRQLPGQQVVHDPLEENRAHTEVRGEKSTEVRVRFLRILQWEIPFADSVRG
jgi:hypothetical protein